MGNANSQDGFMECCASRTRDNHGGSSRERERIQKMQQPEWGCCDVNDTELEGEDSERFWKNARREGSQQLGVEMWTKHSAGVGAVFGVDTTGAVIFNKAVPGSSSQEAFAEGKLKSGDVLFAVDGTPVYRAPLNLVARKLLGPQGSLVLLIFQRGEQQITVHLERRMPDLEATEQVVAQAKESSGVDRVRYAVPQ